MIKKNNLMFFLRAHFGGQRKKTTKDLCKFTCSYQISQNLKFIAKKKMSVKRHFMIFFFMTVRIIIQRGTVYC